MGIRNVALAGSSPHILLPKHITSSRTHVTNGKEQGEYLL